ncbi:hypothetical protein [Effusibacillus consociatus]|uniref:Uncharacterized protein n=1 Tax=Effusibacillus consociatus TaxID=1117041 RepID=A0ABV9Q6E0_9BACL
MREFLDATSKESKEKGITEEELLKELEKVREELWTFLEYFAIYTPSEFLLQWQ